MTDQAHAQAARTPKMLIEEMNRTRTPQDTAAVWFLGQESVVIKGETGSSMLTRTCRMNLSRKPGYSVFILLRCPRPMSEMPTRF